MRVIKLDGSVVEFNKPLPGSKGVDGKQGPQGPAGPEGPAGPKGETGAAGAAGKLEINVPAESASEEIVYIEVSPGFAVALYNLSGAA